MSIRDIEGAVRLKQIDADSGVENPPNYEEMKRVYFRILKRRVKNEGVLAAYFSLSSFRSAMKKQKMLERLKKEANKST